MGDPQSLLELRLSLYELLLALEALAQLGSAAPHHAFYEAWPAIAKTAPARLAQARANARMATRDATTAAQRAAIGAMGEAIDELGEAHAKLGPRSKATAMSLGRVIARLKARSLAWQTAPEKQ